MNMTAVQTGTEVHREMYPEGTKFLLLHMGDDPRPVEDDMRGTVITG